MGRNPIHTIHVTLTVRNHLVQTHHNTLAPIRTRVIYRYPSRGPVSYFANLRLAVCMIHVFMEHQYNKYKILQADTSTGMARNVEDPMASHPTMYYLGSLALWPTVQLLRPSDWPRIQWQSELQQSGRSVSCVDILFFTDSLDFYIPPRYRLVDSVCTYVLRSYWLYLFPIRSTLCKNPCDLNHIHFAAVVIACRFQSLWSGFMPFPHWDSALWGPMLQDGTIIIEPQLVFQHPTLQAMSAVAEAGLGPVWQRRRSFEPFSTIQSIPKEELPNEIAPSDWCS